MNDGSVWTEAPRFVLYSRVRCVKNAFIAPLHRFVATTIPPRMGALSCLRIYCALSAGLSTLLTFHLESTMFCRNFTFFSGNVFSLFPLTRYPTRSTSGQWALLSQSDVASPIDAPFYCNCSRLSASPAGVMSYGVMRCSMLCRTIGSLLYLKPAETVWMCDCMSFQTGHLD